MKKILLPMAVASIFFVSCNNQGSKDSVDKADSANAAKSDTASMKSDSSAMAKPAIKTDDTTTMFLVKAANGGMAEVKLAQIAKQQSKDSTILNFADMMITDHGGANEKVKAFASERNVTLPAEPDAEHLKKADELSKKTGKDFDKAYVDAMVKGHKETLDMFKKASGKVADAPVKAFIDNTIPVIEHHLQRIQDIKKGMK
jgi:putative membrane protein